MEVSGKRAMELLEKIGFTRVAGSQEELQALALEALMELFPDAQDAPAYSLPHFQTLVEMGAFPAENGLLAPNEPMTRAVICRVLATLH